MNNGENIVSGDNAIAFWDNRHRTVDEWRSGGDRGIDVYRNRAFYAHRLGLLVSILDRHHVRLRLRVLDAGCGKGWLSAQLAAQGHDVVGIDTSPRAIEICRGRGGGAFFVSGIDAFRDVRRFDAVVCMDVLFHILDDFAWSDAVRKLAGLLGQGGVLAFSEIVGEQRVTMGDYIVHRPLAEYDSILCDEGLRRIECIPYRFSGNPNAFVVYKR